MEYLDNEDLPEQTVALLKLLEIGQTQVEQGQVKTMEETFQELS